MNSVMFGVRDARHSGRQLKQARLEILLRLSCDVRCAATFLGTFPRKQTFLSDLLPTIRRTRKFVEQTILYATLRRWKLRFLRVKKWSVSFADGRRDQLSG